ncbi:MAG TPA: DegT/DnrJ/EryC1/StrS family aminotransferase [Thermoanaerobaculia bacterium]|nr:DegT/DnrJ/EryC1/StrS family aminotransferase [Thermoanaerobaculia bacterium]
MSAPLRPIRGRDRFLVFGAPAIGEEEIEEVVATLRSGWLGTGPRVARFEEEFRRYKGADHAVAVGSCTAALHLSMLAAGLGPGDEVIVPALTFAATANAVLHAGATPVLADVDAVSFNLDPEDLARKIGPRTRAVVPVHFAGRPCAMEPILDLVARHGLTLVEDCAHAIETTWRGRAAGTLGEFGCFSFYPTKNLTTGEGGMVLTPSADLAARVKQLALHGLSRDAWKRFSDEGYKHYYVTELGFKANLTDLAAAIGLHQLARLEQNAARRLEIWRRYERELADLPLSLPAPEEPETRHAHHLFTVLVDEERAGLSRDRFLERMTEQGIGVGVHYLALPEHPYYRERLGWKPEHRPVATSIGRRTVSLPLSAKLTDEDVADVVAAVRAVLGG